MKRTIFLSLPMRGRESKFIMYTIDKMKTVIRAMYPEDDLTFIDNFTCSVKVGDGLVNGSLLYLGEAIKKMAYCDHIAYIRHYCHGHGIYRGCDIEESVAARYGIKEIELFDNDGEIYLPDLHKKEQELRREPDTLPDEEKCYEGE